MKLIRKEVYVDEIENSDTKLEEVMDDISQNGNVIYYICQENSAGEEPSHVVRAVLTPVDFDSSKFDKEEMYETTVGPGGMITFPLNVVEKLEWKEGDTVEISETETEDELGTCCNGLVLINKSKLERDNNE